MAHKNIVLTGFMGAGKTLVSMKLALELNRERVSTDEVIEERERRCVSDIFADSGESYFRRVEAEVVAEITSRTDLVIDCGGGVVLSEDNIANLRRDGILFYLKASPHVIYERVKDEKDRPILNVPNPLEKIKELLAQREPFYRQADHTIDVDAFSVDEVVQAIIALANKG